jgi:hypothetical protein
MRRPLPPDLLVSKHGRILGRPRKQPPKDAARRIEQAAATGAALIGIARTMNCGSEVLNRWLDENPELREALQRGRETERAALHGVLYTAAMAGNPIAAMFLLKARHGYREGDQGETANRVQVIFSLPGALSPSEYIDAGHPDQRLSAPHPERS